MSERGEQNIIYRHADKGSWEINKQELLASGLSEEESELVMMVLITDFPDWKEVPLKLDGIKRSLSMARELYQNELPQRSVLVATDSGKDRAKLTRSLVTARIAQLEAQDRAKNRDQAKRVDILAIDAKEITDKLADTNEATWEAYGEMIKKEGISESEALARWVYDMNRPGAGVPPEISPVEASQRYRNLIKELRQKITSDQTPVVLLGAGHSGSLAQVRYEDMSGPHNAQDMPEFCEMYKFDEEAKLVETKRVQI